MTLKRDTACCRKASGEPAVLLQPKIDNPHRDERVEAFGTRPNRGMEGGARRHSRFDRPSGINAFDAPLNLVLRMSSSTREFHECEKSNNQDSRA